MKFYYIYKGKNRKLQIKKSSGLERRFFKGLSDLSPFRSFLKLFIHKWFLQKKRDHPRGLKICLLVCVLIFVQVTCRWLGGNAQREV